MDPDQKIMHLKVRDWTPQNWKLIQEILLSLNTHMVYLNGTHLSKDDKNALSVYH